MLFIVSAGILGVEDAFAVAQPCNHRAAGFLSEHVTVGQPELAARLLDDLREASRNGAEKAVTGIDDFVRGVLRGLSLRSLRRLTLVWRPWGLVLRPWGLCGGGIGRRRRIGLGQKGRARQTEEDEGESDGPRQGAHRMLRESRPSDTATHEDTWALRPNRNRIAP